MYDIILIIIVATILAGILWKLKQPPLLSYLIAGILLGPLFLDAIGETGLLEVFSEIGIAFLLFLVGLELNFDKVKQVGKSSIVIGTFQIILTAISGFLLAEYLGFALIPSVYIAIALTFSSTIIVVKLLSDKNDIDSLYGRIAIGLLLVQDFAAILILIFLDMLGMGGGISPMLIGNVLIGAIGIFMAAILSGRYLLPPLFNSIAKSQELLFLSAVSWCFIFATFSTMLGFSIEIGAFLAGISIATLPFVYDIIGKIRSLRDFFVVIFFALLGIKMQIFPALIYPIIAFSLFVMIAKPLIVMSLIGLLGYRKHTSFFSGITSAQISEFSLIIVALGLKLGYVTQEISSMIITIGIIMLAVSTYMITFNNSLYRFFMPSLGIFERETLRKEHREIKKMKNHVILFGCNRMGYIITDIVEKLGKNILVVDFNPDIMKRMRKANIPFLYGDVTDADIIKKANIKDSRIVISTIPDVSENIYLIRACKKHNVPIIATANQLMDANELYCMGADYVLLPHFLAGEKASSMLRDFFKKPSILRSERQRHINYLRKKMSFKCDYRK